MKILFYITKCGEVNLVGIILIVERLNIAINFAYEKFLMNKEGKGLCVLMFTQFNNDENEDDFHKQSGGKSQNNLLMTILNGNNLYLISAHSRE